MNTNQFCLELLEIKAIRVQDYFKALQNRRETSQIIQISPCSSNKNKPNCEFFYIVVAFRWLSKCREKIVLLVLEILRI
jgi:hypothetical protein